MDVEAYRRGDPEALADVVDRVGPWVWALARRGFLCVDALTLGAERTPIRVLGAPTPDVAATLTERVLAQVLTPARRAEAGRLGDLEAEILDETRLELFRAGERAGRLVSVQDPEARAKVPPEVEDLDALLARDGRPATSGLTLGRAEATRIERARVALVPFVEGLDPRSRDLLTARFHEGRSVDEVARSFDCGKAAILAHEGRIRRQARSRVRSALGDPRAGDAEVDALLSDRARDLEPPAPTWERVRRGVLTRTFRDEPAPFSRRLAWGLLVAGLGALGWGLMVGGVLPTADDDTYPDPRVELRCEPACLPGAQVHVAVLAPRGASRFGVALAKPDGSVTPLLVAPDGGSLRLPFGARTRLLPAPHAVRLPSELPLGTRAVAVFADTPLDAAELLELAAGRDARSGVYTATVAAVR